MNTYHVTVIRQDGAWFADVNSLAANLVGATDVPRFADLDVEVRDLIAGLTDADPKGFDLSWRIMFGGTDVTTLVAELEHVDPTLDALEVQRDAIRTELIKAGIASKLSQAAIADVLRVPQQRVGQLANTS